MLILELFSQPYEVKETSYGGRNPMKIYSFETAKGSEMEVMLEKNDDQDLWTIVFKANQSFKFTGKGEAPRVLATVLKILKDHLSEINQMMFTVDLKKPELGAVYKKIVDRYEGTSGLKRITDPKSLKNFRTTHAFEISLMDKDVETVFLAKDSALKET